MYKINTQLKPKGDQPQAIQKLVSGIKKGMRYQTLLGVTGSGKTATMAWVIDQTKRPALIISHNKTLAAQLYQEFLEFFPENEVHYFVSYYDYYQPEAYLPVTDTYIQKDAKINEFIDQLRHASTQAILTRRDCIIIASVSCIYGIGDPEEYEKLSFELKTGQEMKRGRIFAELAFLQYERNDIEKKHGTYSVKGEIVDIVSPDGETLTHVEFFGDRVDAIKEGKLSITKLALHNLSSKKIFPAKHFVTPKDKLNRAIVNIQKELEIRLKELRGAGKLLEAERLKERIHFDIEMLEKTGYVNGIENYSRQLSFRKPGDPPFTLLDYLPDDALIFIDESHMAVPQIRGMYEGDRSRKQTLVDYGFRLPSALDNRPLRFEEFENKALQMIFVSATPGHYEYEKSEAIVEQLIRPTALLEPQVIIRSAKNQIEDVKKEITRSVVQKERILLVTLTKRLAEDISEYLLNHNIRAEYLHSEIKTIDRSKLLERFRKGDFDVIVGINLLREGLDLPEVALVLILDADKEGFLRNITSLIQTIGRAARHPKGRAILYADIVTGSMEKAVEEITRRRKIQEEYNRTHNLKPQAVQKPIRRPFWAKEKETGESVVKILFKELGSIEAVHKELERQMLEAADNLEFERAAKLRDLLKTL